MNADATTVNRRCHVDISYVNVCATFYYLCSLLDGKHGERRPRVFGQCWASKHGQRSWCFRERRRPTSLTVMWPQSAGEVPTEPAAQVLLSQVGSLTSPALSMLLSAVGRIMRRVPHSPP